jgi:type I restriction enzyme S subunit
LAAKAIKTEHAGAKDGGGYWGLRVDAKERSRKLRRAHDKEVVAEIDAGVAVDEEQSADECSVTTPPAKGSDMAGAWRDVNLVDVMNVKHGYAFPGGNIREEPPGDILLTPGNFAIGGGFKADKFKYFDGKVPDEFVLAEGDLVVTMTDLSKQADTLGYPALVPRPLRTRFLHNQRIGKILIRQDAQLNKRFLYYLLCTDEYRNEVLASATGTTVKHTSPGRILAHKVMLPGLPEQRAIAGILGTLDDKIELNRRMNETLEAMARALFKSWFVDFDPVRAKAEGRDPGLPEPFADLFPGSFEGSELGEIPRGWKIKSIGDLADVAGGTTPSTKEPAYWEGGTHAWATPKDLSGLSVPVLLNTERRITDAGLSQIGSGLLPKGTVLLSSRAPIGYLAVAEIPVAINQGFIAMTPKTGTSNIFLLLWASVAHKEIVSRANGSTFLEISKANFRPIPVVTPSADVMRVFEELARPLYERIVESARESRTLGALRDALLPKLISGELRVRDPPRSAQEAPIG